MAMTGRMEADFAAFHAATDQAVVRLRNMELGAGKVEVGLNRMVDRPRAGTNALSEGLAQADKTLAAFGVRIGPQIQAIREIGDAFGKTASQIGVIGTASLAAAAALGGWQVGRLVADFFELDTAIGNATARLLGYGDVAAEVAGAKQDVLARASQHAGREITDMAEAIRINTDAHKAHQDSLNTSAARYRQWRDEIAKVKDEGRLESLTKDLESHNSTLKELSKEYDISVRALEFLERQMKKNADLQKEWAKYQEEAAAAAVKVREIERGQFAERAAGLLGLSALEQQLTQRAMEDLAKKAEAHEKFMKALQAEVDAANEINTLRNLGPGQKDIGLEAALQREKDLAHVEDLRRQGASEFNLGPLILKAFQDFDAAVLGIFKASTTAAPVTVNVSGVWDPATVSQLTDAISAELMRRSGRLFPGS